MLYMVIERFDPGAAPEIYRRAREGRAGAAVRASSTSTAGSISSTGVASSS